MYDPWLEHQLRLADRRGLLTGPRLSRVQEFALDLVLVLEAKAKSEDATERFKLAVLSADPGRFIPLVYPEWGITTEVTVEDLAEPDVEWVMPETSLDEIEATLAELMANDTITLTGDDFPEDD